MTTKEATGGGMTPAEALRRARALIERPEAWTQGELARDSVGRDVGASSQRAACWCAEGAILAVTRTYLESDRPMDLLCKAIRRAKVHQWNDAKRRTHADVIAAFDRAIRLAEEDAK